MQVYINGEAQTLDDGTTIAALLDARQADRRRVAVEVNEDLVPRGKHDTTILEEGDRIEIVTFVGGG